MDSVKKKEVKDFAKNIRLGILEQVYHAQSGHPGGSLSIADIMAYLYSCEMKIDPKKPKDENRDRFILSKGHTAPALYATLANKGYFSLDELKYLRKSNKLLQGHPEMKKILGVDMTSGSLGQGLSVGVGMALSAKLSNKNYRTFVMLGDGEIQEGQIWEAAMLAGHRKIDNLVAIVDNNDLQIDGRLDEVCSPYP
ncbi:MAG: transketolase, partial [Oscillospiraceae bacterium]